VITIRRAAGPDIDAVHAVTVAAYRHYIARIGRPPSPMTTDYADAVAAGQVWVAIQDDQVVGVAVLIGSGDHLLLENLAVLPAAQGTGIGGRLLALTEDQAREQGYGEVRLYTNEAMTENQAYYPRHGYTETHRAGEGGFRRVFYRKRLSAGPGGATSEGVPRAGRPARRD
jgi:N-acetylglutamate synthase-like GNAT family acetyltransferase